MKKMFQLTTVIDWILYHVEKVGEKTKCCSAILLPHLVFTATKGTFQIILFNQLNLFICANICFILMQLQLLTTSVIFTAYLSMPEL